MSRRRLILALAALAIVAAGLAGGYLLGQGSVSSEAEAASARTEAAQAAMGPAFDDAYAAGLADGKADGRVEGDTAGLEEGVNAGHDDGIAAARREMRTRDVMAPASVTTRAEAEPGDAMDFEGSGDVLVVGDSLEVLTSPYLEQYMPPGVKLTVNAEGGYNSLQIFELFKEAYDPSQSVIVFDAGTNDNPAYPEILQGRLAAVSDIVGNRCMVVPTIHGFTVDGVDNAGKNRVVSSFAASHPGTQTPDWAGWVAANQNLMADELHPGAEGSDARARLIAEGVRACLAL